MSDIVLQNGSDKYFENLFIENLKNRKIILNDEITQDIVERVIIPILKWNEEDEGKEISKRKPIELVLNSVGGNVTDGFVACNVIENSLTPVHITTLGMAASMGAYLGMCGTKGLRKCYEFTTYLIHSGSMVLAGNTDDVESTVQYYKDMKADIESFIYKHTKIDKETYKKHQKEEWYLSARKAKELGLVDFIIGID